MRELVLSSEQIHGICKDIGAKLTARLKDEEKLPVFIGVMKGGLNFMMDLIKNVDMPILTDYIQISSYSGTESTGIINLKKDITMDCKGHTVVIVEDVIDTGYSMEYLKRFIAGKHQPKNIIVCALFSKEKMRKTQVRIDYCGKVLNENKFLVGYGLDYNELFRNTPYVFVPSPDEVEGYDKLLKEKN